MISSNDDMLLTEMKRLLPENINFDRFFQILVNEIRSKPELLSYMSVIEDVVQDAGLSLDVGGPKPHAYLIPYGNRCQFQPGYKGLERLARNEQSPKKKEDNQND